MRDLCFVVDATQSMDRVIEGLAHVLPHIMHLASVVGHRLFERVGVLVYRDYSEALGVLRWSAWFPLDSVADVGRLAEQVAEIRAFGGMDYPEAAKSAVDILINEIVERPTVVIWYTDAPPHHHSLAVRHHRAADMLNKNHAKEESALASRGERSTFARQEGRPPS